MDDWALLQRELERSWEESRTLHAPSARSAELLELLQVSPGACVSPLRDVTCRPAPANLLKNNP